eukprot:6201791-Pleurochrysis_carterae.AAC.1
MLPTTTKEPSHLCDCATKLRWLRFINRCRRQPASSNFLHVAVHSHSAPKIHIAITDILLTTALAPDLPRSCRVATTALSNSSPCPTP